MSKAFWFASLLAATALAVDARGQFCAGNVVSNGDFSAGLVPGSMPAGSVTDWSLLTQSPQVVTDGCTVAGALQMWGNLVVGESVQQTLPGAGFVCGQRYRISVCYRWLDNNPLLPPYVRFRLTASVGAPAAYPPLASSAVIGITPNTSSTAWITHTFDWTAPDDFAYLTVNPENDETLNDGNFVSWGQIDDICVQDISCGVVDNGDFTDGLVPGSMPGASVANWSLITQTPQVTTEGCDAPGSILTWGNLVVGESIKQALPGAGFEAGHTYRIKVCYRWIDNNPILPPYVKFRLTAALGLPATYPPISANALIGVTPPTSSLSWITYTFPDWTAPADLPWITVNPENDSTVNDGNFVSWGYIDDICIEEVPCIVSNGHFTDGLVPGSMPAGSVDDWSLLTASPQVTTEGCAFPGSILTWGNLVVGESIQQALPGSTLVAGRTYRVHLCYRWIDNNPILPPFVRFRLTASSAAPVGYPPLSTNAVIGVTPSTSSLTWVSYTFPDWTAPANYSWLTVNPENLSTVNDGNFVSWGYVDDICIEDVTDTRPISVCYGDDSSGPCACGNFGAAGEGCRNSTGAGAILSASGSASLSNDTLVLSSTQTPNQPGIYFQGNSAIANPPIFGDGLRCCGVNVVRIGTYLPAGNTTNTATGNHIGGIGPPISQHPGNANLMCGDSRCYQWWYRDPGANNPCQNMFFNLSNALLITWGC